MRGGSGSDYKMILLIDLTAKKDFQLLAVILYVEACVVRTYSHFHALELQSESKVFTILTKENVEAVTKLSTKIRS